MMFLGLEQIELTLESADCKNVMQARACDASRVRVGATPPRGDLSPVHFRVSMPPFVPPQTVLSGLKERAEAVAVHGTSQI